jgi:hypothetical protein
MFSMGVEIQKNGNPLFQLDSPSRQSSPANAPFVRVRDGESFVSYSKIAFQALQCFTLCFRIPVTMTTNQSFSLLSWINNEMGYTSRIGYTFSVRNSNSTSKLQVEVKGNQGTTVQELPFVVQTGTTAPWYMLIVFQDQFDGNVQGIRMTLQPISQYAANPSFGMNQITTVSKASSTAYFFGNYASSSTMRGELRFGGVGTIDYAWFHGFDYMIEEGEQLRREAQARWIRTWHQSDL